MQLLLTNGENENEAKVDFHVTNQPFNNYKSTLSG